jgi:hypothetical protein
MKKLFTVALFFIALTFNAQVTTKESFIGQWTSSGEATEIIVRKTDSGKIEVLDYSSYSGEQLKVLYININDRELRIKTVFERTNWNTTSEFTFVDNNTLICRISGDGEATVIYKRLH